MKFVPTHKGFGSEMEVRLEVREMHEDAVKGVVGKLFAKTGVVEEVEVVGEKVVELFGRERVFVLVRTPRQKSLYCVFVPGESAGCVGCFNEATSGFRRHGEMVDQQGWRRKESTA
jgi:hypothetical protein